MGDTGRLGGGGGAWGRCPWREKGRGASRQSGGRGGAQVLQIKGRRVGGGGEEEHLQSGEAWGGRLSAGGHTPRSGGGVDTRSPERRRGTAAPQGWRAEPRSTPARSAAGQLRRGPPALRGARSSGRRRGLGLAAFRGRGQAQLRAPPPAPPAPAGPRPAPESARRACPSAARAPGEGGGSRPRPGAEESGAPPPPGLAPSPPPRLIGSPGRGRVTRGSPRAGAINAVGRAERRDLERCRPSGHVPRRGCRAGSW